MIPENTASHTEGLGTPPVPPVVDYDFDNSLLFDASEITYVDTIVPESAALSTISVWFKVEGTPSNNTLVAHISSTRVFLRIANSTSINIDQGATRNYTIPTITHGVWHHIVFSSDVNQLCRIWYDGVESTSGAQDCGNFNFSIGTIGRRGSGVDYFKGYIDDIAFWDTYEASDEVALALYNNGKGVNVEDVLGTPFRWYKLNGSGTETFVIDDGTSALAQNGTLYNFFPNTKYTSPWVRHTSGESALVEDRMAGSSSGAFINGFTEFTESEQGADGDNYNKIDEIHSFNSDQYFNALKGWKEFDTTIKKGTPTHSAYNGFLFDRLTPDVLLAGYAGTDLTKSSATDIFITVFGGTNIITVENMRFFSSYNNASYISPLLIGGLQCNANNNRAIIGALDNGDEVLAHYECTAIDEYSTLITNGVEIIATSLPIGTLATTYEIGGRDSSGNQYLDGRVSMIIIGAANGLDRTSHLANVQRFIDRMLIEKHRTVVNTMLDRYTDLTDREVFALGRLVARGEENGNWSKVDEVFMFGLYNSANSLIGMKSKTAVNYGTDYVAGEGYNVPLFGYIDTTFVQSIDGSGGLGDEFVGMVFSLPVFLGAIRAYSASGTLNKSNLAQLQTSTSTRIYHQSIYYHTLTFLAQPYNQYIYSRRYGGSGSNNAIGYLRWTDSTGGGKTIEGVSDVTTILGHATDDDFQDATIKAYHTGSDTDVDLGAWVVDFNQCVTEIELGKLNDNNDWDIASKTYWWDKRDLAPDQLEEIVTIINANCDSITLGRILDLRDNQGVTINAQSQIDDMTGNKNWVVITV